MTWQSGGGDPVLAETLRLAVACHMLEMRGLTGGERYRRVPRDAAALVGAYGDALQFRGRGGKSARHTADAFNALAAGLAAVAGEDGGVTFHGVHACTSDHEGCPHARPPAEEAPAGPWWAPLAELEELLAAENPAPPPHPGAPRRVETVHIPGGHL